jgi:hypothetical protein
MSSNNYNECIDILDSLAPELRPKSVELHLSTDTDLPAKFGRRIKGLGGTYSDVRGYKDKRFVSLPADQADLIDELLLAYPAYKQTTVIMRGIGCRLGNLSAPTTVRYVAAGNSFPYLDALQQYQKTCQTERVLKVMHAYRAKKNAEATINYKRQQEELATKKLVADPAFRHIVQQLKQMADEKSSLYDVPHTEAARLASNAASKVLGE